MTAEQVTLLAQVLTLIGVVIGVGWGGLQHHWAEKDRARIAKDLATERKIETDKLESDRILLAAELENRNQAQAAAIALALEKRAADIRQALEVQAATIKRQQDAFSRSLVALHNEVKDNTVLTGQAVERADAAYKEANHVNLKIEKANEASLAASQTGTAVMGSIHDVGTDTNTRVRKVEDAVVQSDSAAERTGKRLDLLEESRRTESESVRSDRRRMVETGEDTNKRVRHVEESVGRDTPDA